MDTAQLEAAYRRLLTLAESIPDPSRYPSAAREDIDWTLSHIALSDQILAAAARDLLNEHPAVVDNQHAMDASTIAELLATTDHRHRIAMVRGHAHELSEVLATMPEAAADMPISLRLFDGHGERLSEQQMPWRDLIELRAESHIPGHTARIAAYVSAHRDRAEHA